MEYPPDSSPESQNCSALKNRSKISESGCHTSVLLDTFCKRSLSREGKRWGCSQTCCPQELSGGLPSLWFSRRCNGKVHQWAGESQVWQRYCCAECCRRKLARCWALCRAPRTLAAVPALALPGRQLAVVLVGAVVLGLAVPRAGSTAPLTAALWRSLPALQELLCGAELHVASTVA